VTPPDFTPIDLRHPGHVWLAENLLRGADLDEFFEECPWHPL
jgi:hypothetical protein